MSDRTVALSTQRGFDDPPERLEDEWEVSGLRQAGLNPEVLAEVVQKIESDEHPDFHTLLIARHGRLVFEAYFHGYNSERQHDIRSAGKSFTSTLIGIAIDQGMIPDVDVPMLPYFKHYEPHKNVDHWKESIRVRDLLRMMSGLDADDNDASTPGCEDNMVKSYDWVRYSLNLPMREAPGQRWVYAAPNTMLLAGILESATQRSVLDFATEYLFGPLGIDKFHWKKSPQGRVVGQGNLFLRGRDMLKLGQLFLDGGCWQGRRLVSERWTQAATKRWVGLGDDVHPGYGYQWWSGSYKVDTRNFNCYFASGNGGNKIYVLPTLGMVVAVASSAYNQPYMHPRSHRVLMQVIRAAI